MTQNAFKVVATVEWTGFGGQRSAGEGQQVRGSRKGPRSNTSGIGGAVVPTCPLCHTVSAVVTSAALLEGAFWRCTRCGQIWDAFRLQTAAEYSRHAQRQRGR